MDAYETPKNLLPPVADFSEFINGNEFYKSLFQGMFDQVPTSAPYDKTPTGTPQVRDAEHMLQLINEVMTMGSEFNDTELVGFPINAIINWPMATGDGNEVFLNPEVNEKLKAILDYWMTFLSSKASLYVLSTKGGWLSDDALNKMLKAAEAEPGQKLWDVFNCPTTDLENSLEFACWDDFFTRTFKTGMRPIASPEDNSIIVNTCESSPYRLVKGALKSAAFNLKAQTYSLQNILNGDNALTSQFYGGTVYEAFLDALSYHRWHSPVSGTITKVEQIYNTYYSENLYEGFVNIGPDGKTDPDPGAPNNSQAYLTAVATRVLIYIQADNKDIGLICFIAVGMAEVSSNEVTVKEGQHVNKGEQIGMFHFGGSTHCLVFRKGVNINFDFNGQTPSLNSTNIKLGAKIGQVVAS